MKKIIFLSITISMVACNPKSNTTETNSQIDSTTTESTAATTIDSAKAEDAPIAQLYACPMHPEIQGKKGEKCSKCGMALTEPVKK